MSKAPSIRLPSFNDRTAVIGTTGSGKTVFSVWLLSKQDFSSRPWVIIDYKGDELINSISRAVYIDYSEVPTKPGIYILRVMPGDELELDDWFRRVWEQENIGIYVDEGFMVGRDSRWFNACLTQGRSKCIPMIVLTQRPVWLSRFVFSESGYFAVFRINDKRDLDTLKSFVPIDDLRQMPKYHSLFYDVAQNATFKLGPVPDGEKIVAEIDEQLPKRRKRL